MTEPECRAQYQRPGGRLTGDRNVRCNRPANHDGDHEEADTEATWPRDEPNVPPEPHAQDAERRDELATLRARVSELLAQIAASESASTLGELRAELAEANLDAYQFAFRDSIAAIRRQAHVDGYAKAVEFLRDDERYDAWCHDQQTHLPAPTSTRSARSRLAGYLEAVGEPRHPTSPAPEAP